MGRQPLDPSHDSIYLSVRLTRAQMNLLDRRRGDRSRSEYIRDLLDSQTGPVRKPKTVTKSINDLPPVAPPLPVEPFQPPTTGRAHKFTGKGSATTCSRCGQRREWADPFCD